MSIIDRIAIGRNGEREAARALKRHGYRIIEKNYRCRYGEIDIVAEQAGVLCFIEVKTRGSDRFGSPKEGVDYRKQRHITRASSMYLAESGFTDRDVRFDVVSIELTGGGYRTEIVKDAFEATELF
ncbi:MAG: YraN family protein [Thermodesulfobacteriota bacterium]